MNKNYYATCKFHDSAYHVAGIFRGGKIFVDMENFAGSWKTFRGYVYACTYERCLLHLW